MSILLGLTAKENPRISQS